MKGSFRDLIEAAPDAMIIVNSRGQIVLVNAQTEKLFGYHRGELLHQPLEILIPPRFRNQHHESRDQFFSRARSRPMGSGRELPALRKDGTEFPADIALSPVDTEDGMVVLAAVRDITERKKNEEIARQHTELQVRMAKESAELAAAKKELETVAERERAAEALRRSEARVRRLVESNIIGIATGDLDGKVIDANDAFLALLGFTKEDVAAGSMRWDALTPPEYREADRLAVEQLLSTGVAPLWEKQFIRKDGSRVPVLIGVATLTGMSGETEAVSFVVDITERKKLEQQLRQAQKVEAIGQLAGGIAHDFNNLLGIIIGYSEIFEERLGLGDPLRPKAEQIKKAGRRAASLTRQLLAFSRQQALEPKVLDLNAVIADTLKMLRRLIDENVELVAVPEPALGRVSADQGQIEQIIMNLTVNARDAMPHGGKLTISTSNAEMDDAFVRRNPGAVPGSYVVLSVGDTGCGMDHETQAHIFEPFFTTKGEGKGTGLGLATVYGVVKQSGGYISVESEPGKGSTFRIYLPRIEETVAATSCVDGGGEKAYGCETVLLVEDAHALRELARELLEAGGYTVLEAANGADAISLAEKHPGPIHLLLSDVVMPGMNGPELAGKIIGGRPDTKVLYMSGYTGDALPVRELLNSGAALLHKPFTGLSLATKVREVLGAAKPAPSTVPVISS
jgi:two-component system cell cycle sensor histidine kinase/response regulator CckA